MLAARMGCEKCCQELLNKRASTDEVNADGDTALHLASRHGHVPVVNLLMDHHADLANTNNVGATFLGAAVKAGMSDVASAIASHKRYSKGLLFHSDWIPWQLRRSGYGGAVVKWSCVQQSQILSAQRAGAGW